MADLLGALFYLPTRHMHEYGRLLLKLATCFEVVGQTNTTITCFTSVGMPIMFEMLFYYN